MNIPEGVKINPKLLTEEEMKKNMEKNGGTQMKMTKDAIPDLKQLTTRVLEILELSDTEDMINLENTQKNKYIQLFNEKFLDVPYSILKLLLDRERREENLSKLLEMFAMMHDIKDNKLDLEEAYDNYSEKLREEFIYPKFGGKEGFEKKMMEDFKKKESLK
jgi:hypothetical protein